MKTIIFALVLGLLLFAGCTLPGQQAGTGTQAQGGNTAQSGNTGALTYPQAQTQTSGTQTTTQTQACEEYANYAKGELYGVYGTYTNACVSSDLKVYSCRGGVVEEDIVRCGWNCLDAACVHRNEGFCVESNEQDDRYRRGETKMTVSTAVMERVTDRCASPTLLYEYHCRNEDIERLDISCECSEGECVR
ncbi:MAG: hypothetical protein NTY83_00190 [Candidatus Micrarchaeota archaeon]|nr:hypothetical protein [Candidatus Micrarchaeota archaeon]